MRKIILHNIGPVASAEVTLNKVNVLIGPQSSGKSTIAKLVSFCLWLEKDVMLRGTEHINADFMQRELIAYHKMESFFNDDSRFEYTGEVIELTFNSVSDYTLKMLADNEAKMCRIAYIPAERNFVTIPNITTLTMPANYVRNFIFEWLGLRGKYAGKQSLDLPGLDVQYRYSDGAGDTVVIAGGQAIALTDASSGLQSIVPLVASVHYNTVWVYNNDADVDYEKYTARMSEGLDAEGVKRAKTMTKMYRMRPELFTGDLAPFAEFLDRMTHPHLTHLIVEEPEQNIFPVTQYELMKYLVSSINHQADSTLLVTTHSPYVLTALNNLIQAAASGDAGAAVVGKGTTLPFESVAAYAVEDGVARDIRDTEFRLIAAESIDRASQVIAADFTALIQ